MLQLLLLTKAVLVALYGDDAVLPSRHGRESGLLLLFTPIVGCALLMAGEHLALGAYITGPLAAAQLGSKSSTLQAVWLTYA